MAILCISLIIVSVCDYMRKKIPNWMVALIFAMGMWHSFYLSGVTGAGMYILVVLAVVFSLYPFFRIGGLGAGDVKLLSVCSGYFMKRRILYFLFFSMLISVVFSIVKLFRERNVRERLAYFGEYCIDVARSGKWKLYLPKSGEERLSGICMSGPILCSVILGLGGIY